jgi:hypothetical protein
MYLRQHGEIELDVFAERREVQESECFVVSIVVEWGGAVVVVIVRSEGEGSRRPTRYAHEL